VDAIDDLLLVGGDECVEKPVEVVFSRLPEQTVDAVGLETVPDLRLYEVVSLRLHQDRNLVHFFLDAQNAPFQFKALPEQHYHEVD